MNRLLLRSTLSSDRADGQVLRSARCVEGPAPPESERSAVELLPNRLGDQDLASLGAVPDAGRDVDVDAQEVALHLAGRASMDTRPLLRPVALHLDLPDAALGFERRRDGLLRAA